MLLWTLLTACTQEPPPVAGSIQLCIPSDLSPSMSTEEPISITGNLVDIREGSECAAELVFQTEDAEHVVGYTILDPQGNDATFLPEWSSAEDVTLTTHIAASFGMSYGLVLEDESGIMMALDEGTWGGALRNAGLPFAVEQSEHDIGTVQEECASKTGYTFKIGEDHMAPFGVFDLVIEEQSFDFVAVSAIEYGPGLSCSISDLSDEFAWGIFRK